MLFVIIRQRMMMRLCEGEPPTPSACKGLSKTQSLALNIDPQAEAWGYTNKACLRRLKFRYLVRAGGLCLCSRTLQGVGVMILINQLGFSELSDIRSNARRTIAS